MTLKNINWHDFITPKFWFTIDTTRIHPSEKAFLYLAGVLILLGILVLVFAKLSKNKFLARVATRFAKIFFTIGIVEAIWFGLRYEYAQVLGTKFVAVLILLWGIIWMYWPVKYLFTHYKVDMAEAQRAASRDKYLKKS